MKVLAFHPEKCTGCQLCALACSGQNEDQFNPRLARLRIASEYTDQGINVEGHTCDLGMSCVEACPTDAIFLKNNRLAYDQEKCTYCGLCIDICPNKVIVRKKDSIGVCVQCMACVKWCPNEALTIEEVSN